jgi:hydroxypyruvate isomerase
MSLRFSVPDWCFYRADDDPAVYYRQLAALGITAVEMVASARWAAARAAGLEIINLAGPGMTRGLNRREHHASLLPEIREVIAQAGAAGIPHVIVFSGNREGQADAEGIANCVAGLKALAPDTEAAGVTLLFEMLNSLDHADYQADSGAYGFQVARGVGSPAVCALYDIYHLARMGEDVLADLPANLDLVAHLHVAETPRRTVPVAGGAIDYPAIVRAVQAAGYQGYWGLEFLPGEDRFGEITAAMGVLGGGRV